MIWHEKQIAHSRKFFGVPNDFADPEEPNDCIARHGSIKLYLLVLSLILNVFTLVLGLSWYRGREGLPEGVLTYSNIGVTFDGVPGYDVAPRQPDSLWEGLTAAPNECSWLRVSSHCGPEFVLNAWDSYERKVNITVEWKILYGDVPSITLSCMALLKYVSGTTYDTWNNSNSSYTPSHLNHCFDYLRQSIMCAGDLTLEPILPDEINEGWGVEHQCRDYDAIQEFVTAHHIGNQPIIDG